MLLFFPWLKKINLNNYIKPSVKILKIIRDNKMDITVDIEIPYLSQYWTLDINKHKLYNYDWFNSLKKFKKNLQFIAMKISYSNEYNYFSFESAIVDFGYFNKKINFINNFWTSIKNTEFNFKNIKMLPDIENEEIKTNDKFEEILDLKMFIEEHQFENNRPEVIFKLSNIYMVKSVIDQPFNSNLLLKILNS